MYIYIYMYLCICNWCNLDDALCFDAVCSPLCPSVCAIFSWLTESMMFRGHFPQKSPMIRGFFAKRDLRLTARPYASCKIFKGRPRRNAFSKLVHRRYKSFPSDRFCQVEMINPTRLSNKTSNAWSCAEDQILENKNLRNMILNVCTER